MSGTLPPGTRIPLKETMLAMKDVHDRAYEQGLRMGTCTNELKYGWGHHDGYWKGLAEGLTLGTIAGSLVTACALALAWAHMGG